MVCILLRFFGAYQGCGSRAMMTIGNIKSRHGFESFCDSFYIFFFVDHPE